MNDEQTTAAVIGFYRHRQLNPPEGLCECGYEGRLGEHFLAHVFKDVFDPILEDAWNEGFAAGTDYMRMDESAAPNPYEVSHE